MKKLTFTIMLLLLINISNSQVDSNQNGIRSTVITNLYTTDTQAKRYEIANLGYNSNHWQAGGLLIIELFQTSFGTGYERYIIENGYAQGAGSGSPAIKLVESHGIFRSGKISLGTPIDLTTIVGGYVNKNLPIFFDVRYYATYRIKITYLQEKVSEVNNLNQIKINQSPIAVNIPDFSVSTELNHNLITSGLFRVSGNGNHFIRNGNLGIGTTSPDEKLTVAGNIHAREVKVTLNAGSVPDYVFANDYKLKSLQEVENYIKINSHLPEIPSAKEIEKNGLMLAEMNMSLLKKIEELTLYMIEMKKENEEMKKDILTLKK